MFQRRQCPYPTHPEASELGHTQKALLQFWKRYHTHQSSESSKAWMHYIVQQNEQEVYFTWNRVSSDSSRRQSFSRLLVQLSHIFLTFMVLDFRRISKWWYVPRHTPASSCNVLMTTGRSRYNNYSFVLITGTGRFHSSRFAEPVPDDLYAQYWHWYCILRRSADL